MDSTAMLRTSKQGLGGAAEMQLAAHALLELQAL
jgi:hypothetical protein